MEKSLTQIVEEIAQLQRAEKTVLARAAKVDYHMVILRTKKERILAEARAIQDKRHELAREYHRIKSPCPTVLSEAEKQLGRKLTLDEVQKIEIYYAKKVGNSTCLS
jgi:HPt (histidine-containing phosphotransfer) domain-containing protein